MSLQRRIILGGLLWALLTTFIGAFAVTRVFDQIADRRFDLLLEERHNQVIAAIGGARNFDDLQVFLTDPAYDRAYSGRYWQIAGPGGERLTSPSLFDSELQIIQSEQPIYWEGRGPSGWVRGRSEIILTEAGTVLNVAVAENLSALTAERQEMRRSVTFAFGIVGAFGIFAAAFLTTSLLAPLRKLSDDVKRRWESGVDLKSDNYPKEVAPLVNDINGLLVRNRDIIERGRRQAADLAHALKTPAAALRNEIESLDANGTDTALLSGALDRIDAQIQRSLSRMRATTAANGVNLSTDVSNSVERLHRLFSKLPDSSDKSFHLENAQVSVAMDQQDLEELIGNLLENAFKWCASAVSICVQKADGQAKVLVEDDGPGIAPKDRSFALADGARLDTSVPGTGLGLSIANDLAKAYGGSLQLETSEKLGGLKVEVTLPSIGSATAST